MTHRATPFDPSEDLYGAINTARFSRTNLCASAYAKVLGTHSAVAFALNVYLRRREVTAIAEVSWSTAKKKTSR